MGASGGFPIDLVLFGMIAAFLVLRLRSILGKRTGFERPAPPVQQAPLRPASGPVIDVKPEVVAPAAADSAPAADTPAGRVLARMRETDRNFEPGRFLTGVDQAFRMIVAAFAAGNRAGLRPLLGDEIYAAFDAAIGAREKAGETQVSEIKAVQRVSIDAAELKGRVGSITARIVSDQVSYTQDGNGRPLTGADAVTEITDLWTFERDLTQPDPTWRLVAARSG
jgi:predicted lipid-binding transport protein (Tim44 family)